MARVLYLRDVLELIHNRFDDGALPEHDLIEHEHKPILHPRFQLGHESDSILIKRLEKRLRDVALIAEEFAKQLPDQFRHGLSVIHIAGSKPQCEQLAA